MEICLQLPKHGEALKAPPEQSCAIHKTFSSVWHWRASWSPLAQDAYVSSCEPISLKGGMTQLKVATYHQRCNPNVFAEMDSVGTQTIVVTGPLP